MYFRKVHHAFAYAPINLDGQIGIVADVPPARWWGIGPLVTFIRIIFLFTLTVKL